jgi:hypothetical protein
MAIDGYTNLVTEFPLRLEGGKQMALTEKLIALKRLAYKLKPGTFSNGI